MCELFSNKPPTFFCEICKICFLTSYLFILERFDGVWIFKIWRDKLLNTECLLLLQQQTSALIQPRTSLSKFAYAYMPHPSSIICSAQLSSRWRGPALLGTWKTRSRSKMATNSTRHWRTLSVTRTPIFIFFLSTALNEAFSALANPILATNT